MSETKPNSKEYLNAVDRLCVNDYKNVEHGYAMRWNDLHIVSDALLRYTPMKPHVVKDCEDEPLCPYCHTELDGSEEHCNICDQRIDWSEWF